MATNGHFCWPSVGSYVAAYGQFFMAANKAVQPSDGSSNHVIQNSSKSVQSGEYLVSLVVATGAYRRRSKRLSAFRGEIHYCNG
ncbi:hypothetical protein BJ956_000588 [Arthrobacter psychrochitiniphilus]|nr:hypothetical protein [Arthrobacter psychrochitiniphilus]